MSRLVWSCSISSAAQCSAAQCGTVCSSAAGVVESNRVTSFKVALSTLQTSSCSIVEGDSMNPFHALEKRATEAPSTILWSADQLTVIILVGTGSRGPSEDTMHACDCDIGQRRSNIWSEARIGE